jgi:hypothetical protein
VLRIWKWVFLIGLLLLLQSSVVADEYVVKRAPKSEEHKNEYLCTGGGCGRLSVECGNGCTCGCQKIDNSPKEDVDCASAKRWLKSHMPGWEGRRGGHLTDKGYAFWGRKPSCEEINRLAKDNGWPGDKEDLKIVRGPQPSPTPDAGPSPFQRRLNETNAAIEQWKKEHPSVDYVRSDGDKPQLPDYVKGETDQIRAKTSHTSTDAPVDPATAQSEIASLEKEMVRTTDFISMSRDNDELVIALCDHWWACK